MNAPARIRRGEGGRFLGDLSKLEARRRREEDALQKQIVTWCRFCLARNVLFFSVPNERRPDDMLGRMVAMGLRPGAADLVLIHEGRAFFPELKAKDGYQSDTQEVFERDARLAGAAYRIVRSLDEFREAMRDWGIPHREVRR